MSKLVKSIKETLALCGLKDGDTISFHHALRDGDYVMNLVLEAIDQGGFKDLTLAPSAIFSVSQETALNCIKKGTIRKIETAGIVMPGILAPFISKGGMEEPVIYRTHGGRPKAIEDKDIDIDIAFVAAPTSDPMGNLTGVLGPSACGSLGYVMPDVWQAKKVVIITDNLVDYPCPMISIDETRVDYVVEVENIGDPAKISSGIIGITRDPVFLKIAQTAAKLIENSGYFKPGFSFQTGAGGSSLATALYLKDIMREQNIQGSYCMGGITSYLVDLLEEGLFKTLFDVQCFDIKAIESLKKNPGHLEISASQYANLNAPSCVAQHTDVVMLGATEIDTSFNVNIHTDSTGELMSGAGGHTDIARGSKLAIVAAPLMRARTPIVVDRVTTISTPGNTIDVLITERGVAVNPLRQDIKDRLKEAGLRTVEIEELKDLAYKLTGAPKRLRNESNRIVAKIMGSDSALNDVVYRVDA